MCCLSLSIIFLNCIHAIFFCRVMFHFVSITQLVYPFSYWLTSGFFFTTVYKATMNILVTKLLWKSFNLSWVNTWERILGNRVGIVLFNKISKNFFQIDCTVLYTCWLCLNMRFWSLYNIITNIQGFFVFCFTYFWLFLQVHCGFNLHFPGNWRCQIFFMGSLCIFFCKVSIFYPLGKGCGRFSI